MVQYKRPSSPDFGQLFVFEWFDVELTQPNLL